MNEVSEGVSDEDASDVDKGDFYAEKGASKSVCGCILSIRGAICMIVGASAPTKRYKITPCRMYAYKEPNV